jgi:orotate phosphoribosyltransferase
MASIFVVGGIVSSVNSVLGSMAIVTAAGASVVRYAVILTNADRHRVERMTAYGFHFGILVAAILFILDLALD